MGSRAHTSRAWEYGRNMLKKGQEYRRLGDIGAGGLLPTRQIAGGICSELVALCSLWLPCPLPPPRLPYGAGPGADCL